MDRLLRRFLPQLNEHLTDDRLVGLWGSDLAAFEGFVARRHLAGCSLCRVRLENIEGRAYLVMAQLQHELELEEKPIPPDDTERFLQRLDRDYVNYMPQKRPQFRWPMIFTHELSSMNPALIGMTLALASAVFVGIHLWNLQRTPDITSNALLVRAEKWDTASFADSPRVVYQAVKIKTPRQTVQRAIYRDTQGKRRLKQVTLDSSEAQMKDRMATAGIDWDDPLSASNYQEWHDREHVREDEIKSTGHRLLTLTTTAAQGPVAEQSLTVRVSDFHPVRRTVEFRDKETVEIAELDFKILPWSSVDASVFEPSGNTSMATSDTPARVLPFIRPETVTDAQLDEAELGARLVLNQLHADAGGQIEVERNSQGVQVKGLVETDQRKTELQARLRMVPHVSASVRSFEELQRHPDPQPPGENATPKVSSAIAEPSPIEIYFTAHGQNKAALSQLSRELLDHAVAVDQESRALASLLRRFGSGEKSTPLTEATLAELVFSHRQSLLTALRNEQETLARMEVLSGAKPPETPSSPTVPLVDAAEKNLALCHELTVGGGSSSRRAETIAADLAVSLNAVRVSAHEAKLPRQHNDTANGSNHQP